ncbi:putative secreted protein [Salmonella enterica subsp. enterica serovar Adelaide str. A4-669]|uniref:Putative secreted protein n=2 Tax=Salmonella enterica TaxID=28901 RepID=A0A6C8GNQ2_SALET|nr:putative secreted protein [Salmonella enterica subsp. enterica serovar Adelaide str. A4-669]
MMNNTLSKRLCLTAMLTLAAVVYTTSAFAETSKLVIESGDSAQSRQEAAMEKEQWNDTRSLRQKVNTRAEKEWDKADAAFDNRDKCEQSANINAYWEPNGSPIRCGVWILGAQYAAVSGSSYRSRYYALMQDN